MLCGVTLRVHNFFGYSPCIIVVVRGKKNKFEWGLYSDALEPAKNLCKKRKNSEEPTGTVLVRKGYSNVSVDQALINAKAVGARLINKQFPMLRI